MIHGFCCWSHFNPSSGPRGFTAVLLVNYLLPRRRRFWGSRVSSELTGVQESEILLIYLPRKSLTSQLFVLKSMDVWSFSTVKKGLPSKAPQRCDHESSGHSATVEILCADARTFQEVSHHCGTPPVWTRGQVGKYTACLTVSVEPLRLIWRAMNQKREGFDTC